MIGTRAPSSPGKYSYMTAPCIGLRCTLEVYSSELRWEQHCEQRYWAAESLAKCMPVSKHRCFQPVLHRNHETTSPSLQEIRLQGVQDRFLNGNYFRLWVFGWVANLILMRSSQAYMIIYELCHPNVCCPSIRCDSGDCCDNTWLQWAWLHLNLQPRWASDVVSWNQSRAGRKHPTTLALEPQLLTLFCGGFQHLTVLEYTDPAALKWGQVTLAWISHSGRYFWSCFKQVVGHSAWWSK